MTLKSHLLLAALTFLGCFVMLSLRPVPAASVYNTNSVAGNVIEILENEGPGDLHIHLANDDRTFYINRGSELGLNPDKLRYHLLDRNATLTFVEHWTPLDSGSKLVPISKLSVGGRTYWQQSTP